MFPKYLTIAVLLASSSLAFASELDSVDHTAPTHATASLHDEEPYVQVFYRGKGKGSVSLPLSAIRQTAAINRYEQGKYLELCGEDQHGSCRYGKTCIFVHMPSTTCTATNGLASHQEESAVAPSFTTDEKISVNVYHSQRRRSYNIYLSLAAVAQTAALSRFKQGLALEICHNDWLRPGTCRYGKSCIFVHQLPAAAATYGAHAEGAEDNFTADTIELPPAAPAEGGVSPTTQRRLNECMRIIYKDGVPIRFSHDPYVSPTASYDELDEAYLSQSQSQSQSQSPWHPAYRDEHAWGNRHPAATAAMESW